MALDRRRVLGAGAALSAALAAPRLAEAQNRRVLRFIPQADLGVLDPIWTAGYVTRNHTASWSSTRSMARTARCGRSRRWSKATGWRMPAASGS